MVIRWLIVGVLIVTVTVIAASLGILLMLQISKLFGYFFKK